MEAAPGYLDHESTGCLSRCIQPTNARRAEVPWKALRYITILLLHGCASSMTPRPADRMTLAAYVDSATGLMQQHSFKRSEVDWPALRAAARAAVDTAARPDTGVAYNAVRAALTRLADGHSFLLGPREAARLEAPKAITNAPPEIRSVAGGVGFVQIPQYSGLDSAQTVAYAVAFQKRLGGVVEKRVCAWVVDLRGNRGGNMWPMIAGIGPVLGDGLAGMFVGPDSTLSWGYQQGAAWVGEDTVTRVPNPLVLTNVPPVAVLTDSLTASSGEALAISFRGRPETRSFGQSTHGMTTANDNYPLPDGSMLFLAVAVEADRTGRRYGGKVEPDVTILGAEVLDTAVAWLRGTPACRKHSN